MVRLPPDDAEYLVVDSLGSRGGRYPDDFDEATRAQAMEALDIAGRIVVFVERRLAGLFGRRRLIGRAQLAEFVVRRTR